MCYLVLLVVCVCCCLSRACSCVSCVDRSSWSFLLVLCRLLFIVCCSVVVVCQLLHDGCPFVACCEWFDNRCLRFVGCCLLL